MQKIDLAIIIPAYKGFFFRKALNALAAQTNKNFKVYIGDDNSPDNLIAIVKDFEEKLDITYKKFSINVGSKDLVQQWQRCVDLMNDESWFWCFSDDDLADPNCVEEFYSTIQKDAGYFDVYRFNTKIIDNQDGIISETPKSPEIENAYQHALGILSGKRGVSLPDHIWKKKAFDELGGFVNSYKGQASDWATSVKFAGDKGIYTIANAFVLWRSDGYNISSNAFHDRRRMMVGHLNSLSAIYNFLKNNINKEQNISLKNALKENIYQVFSNHYKGIDWNMIVPLTKNISRNLPLSKKESSSILIQIKYKELKRRYSFLNYLAIKSKTKSLCRSFPS